MGRLLYILIVFLGCVLFFKVFAPLLLVFLVVYLGMMLFRSLFNNQPKEEYYENTQNTYQNSESDIIDVDYKIVDEE